MNLQPVFLWLWGERSCNGTFPPPYLILFVCVLAGASTWNASGGKLEVLEVIVDREYLGY